MSDYGVSLDSTLLEFVRRLDGVRLRRLYILDDYNTKMRWYKNKIKMASETYSLNLDPLSPGETSDQWSRSKQDIEASVLGV